MNTNSLQIEINNINNDPRAVLEAIALHGDQGTIQQIREMIQAAIESGPVRDNRLEIGIQQAAMHLARDHIQRDKWLIDRYNLDKSYDIAA